MSLFYLPFQVFKPADTYICNYFQIQNKPIRIQTRHQLDQKLIFRA